MNSLALYYNLSLLYEINSCLDDAETMYKKASAIEMSSIFLKVISATMCICVFVSGAL